MRVFESRVLRKIFGSERDEVTGELRKYNVELNDRYYSPNIVRAIKSRRMMGGACSAYGGEERHTQGFGGES
jgi:hypothetical protein